MFSKKKATTKRMRICFAGKRNKETKFLTKNKNISLQKLTGQQVKNPLKRIDFKTTHQQMAIAMQKQEKSQKPK
jgi:hypothetical protein